MKGEYCNMDAEGVRFNVFSFPTFFNNKKRRVFYFPLFVRMQFLSVLVWKIIKIIIKTLPLNFRLCNYNLQPAAR